MLLTGALLFVLLGLFGDRNGNPDTNGRDLRKAELVSPGDGLVPEILNNPVVSVTTQLTNLPCRLSGDHTMRMEHYRNSLSGQLISTLHIAYLDYRPVLFLRTGLLMHRANPGNDPSLL